MCVGVNGTILLYCIISWYIHISTDQLYGGVNGTILLYCIISWYIHISTDKLYGGVNGTILLYSIISWYIHISTDKLYGGVNKLDLTAAFLGFIQSDFGRFKKKRRIFLKHEITAEELFQQIVSKKKN